jgi:DNA-directed RNA polymerase subunit beta'
VSAFRGDVAGGPGRDQLFGNQHATDSATLGRVDYLRGFKENVIMGHLIPAGTGFPLYRSLRLKMLAEPQVTEEKQETNELVEAV